MMTKVKNWAAPPQFDRDKDNRTAYLLNVISFSYLLVLGGIFALGVFQGGVFNFDKDTFYALSIRVLPSIIAFVFAQSFMRTGKIMVATHGYLAIIWLSYVIGIWLWGEGQAVTYSNFVLAVLIAGLLIGNRAALLVAVMSMLLGFVAFILQNQGLMHTSPIPDVERVLRVTLNLLLSAVYLSLYISQLDEALASSKVANETLEHMRDNLEHQVGEHKRDLKLAHEIGRRISEIRDANQILFEAVKQIHREFDLYLAQVYLVDDEQEMMLLQAAEGEVASRLLAQEHYLAINTASINGTAVSEKRTIVVSDTIQDPRFRPNPLLPETRSEIAAPLIMADRVLGVLNMQSSKPHAFSPENIPTFNAIASQLAVSLENAALVSDKDKNAVKMEALLADTKQQTQRLAALNQMGQDLASASDIDDVYQIVGAHILNIIEGNTASLALASNQEDKTEIIVLQGQQRALPTGISIPIAGTAIGLAIQENRVIQLPQESPLPTFTDSRQLAQQGVRSFLTAPLTSHGQLFGTLNIGSPQAYAFTEADVSLIQQIATLLATTIHNKNLSEQVQNWASIVESHPNFIGTGTLQGEAIYINPAGLAMLRLPADYDVRGLLATDVYPEEDAQRLLHEGIPAALETGSWTSEGRLLRADGKLIPIEQTIAINLDADDKASRFSVTMRDISERLEAIEAQRKLTTQLEERLLQVNAMQRAMTHEGWSTFLTSPKRMIQGFKFGDEQLGLITTRDVTQGSIPTILEAETFTQHDPATAAAAVQVRGETIGVIGAKNKNGEPLDDEQLAMLNSLTQQVANALDRARLFEEMEIAREQMNALYTGSEKVVHAQTISQVLEALVEATALKNMDRVNILFFDKPWDDTEPEKMTIAADWTKEAQPHPSVGMVYSVQQLPSIRLLSRDKPVIFDDIENDDLLGSGAKRLAKAVGVKSIAIFPLVAGEHWFGILTVQSLANLNLTENDIRQITSLVEQAASVSQTQRLFKQTQSRARHEQLLREVTAKVYAAPDAESVLKTAVKEVNRIMGVDSFVYLDQSPALAPLDNGHHLETEEHTTQEE
ncbi:MAG: hypothetical protein CSB13_02320 [Chloroflexi bacterium]|nr:MAG: hypothetical protein CSB13_02320 [Chloroflexota bacterium]